MDPMVLSSPCPPLAPSACPQHWQPPKCIISYYMFISICTLYIQIYPPCLRLRFYLHLAEIPRERWVPSPGYVRRPSSSWKYSEQSCPLYLVNSSRVRHAAPLPPGWMPPSAASTPWPRPQPLATPWTPWPHPWLLYKSV